MIKTLKGTTAQGIQNALIQARHNLGAASGMVFTLIVVAEIHDYDDVMDACVAAGREHPSRILLVTNGTARADRLDAEVHLGEDVPGEIIALRFQGEVAHHRDSVLLPLLLPDSPVVVWWPGVAPVSLADDPIGRLGARRISDALGAPRPLEALRRQATSFSPGDSDLTWTRLTPWRALLTAALDQHPARVESARVAAAGNNAAGLLLAAWLRDRLVCDVVYETSDGPGITQVELRTEEGTISVTRRDGKMASFEAPSTPRRTVALRRRNVNQLITEELRRMDADVVLGASMKSLLRHYQEALPPAPAAGEAPLTREATPA